MKCNSYHHFFEVLANQTRFKIIESLKKSEKCVNEICLDLKEEQSKISHNLKIMLECKILEVKNEGKNRIYFLNKNTIKPILKIVEEHVKNNCKICKKIKFQKI